MPKPLPPVPPIAMDDEMWSVLSRADRALGRLDGITEILPNADLFVLMYVKKEAVLSSQIEGTQASLQDVLEYEASALEHNRPQDAPEVINYVNAMKYGLKRLDELPVSLRLIKEIHKKMLTGVRGSKLNPGEFRQSQNWIGATGSDISTAKYIPPPPHEIMDSLGNLETFFHDETPMPDLIRVGIAHSQFETIHPFLDGNGRIGRLLITFLLCERGVLGQPLLYLSHYFKQNRQEYYEQLQNVRDSGDWESWLKFFLNGVFEVARQATDTARKILELRRKHRALISSALGKSTGRALVLLDNLYEWPVTSIDGVADVTGGAYSSAQNLVNKFCSLGILRESTGKKRNKRYQYYTYLDLFDD